MIYKIAYSFSAERDLLKIKKKDAGRIVRKIVSFSKLEDPFSKAKKLKGFDSDTYRFRIGDFRAIFRIDEKNEVLTILVILKIANKKDAYSR